MTFEEILTNLRQLVTDLIETESRLAELMQEESRLRHELSRTAGLDRIKAEMKEVGTFDVFLGKIVAKALLCSAKKLFKPFTPSSFTDRRYRYQN